jgi:hypothetical protein
MKVGKSREKIIQYLMVVDRGVGGGGGREEGGGEGILLLYTSFRNCTVDGPSDSEFLQPLDLAFTLIYKLLP